MLCSVGIRPPGIEVRFKDIFIETSVYTNVSRNLPSILNAYRGAVEVSSSVLQASKLSAPVVLRLSSLCASNVQRNRQHTAGSGVAHPEW